MSNRTQSTCASACRSGWCSAVRRRPAPRVPAMSHIFSFPTGMAQMSDVYVVGIDMIRFGRYPERTVVQLAADAALLALDDCGVGIHDVQALFSGNIGETMTGQRTLQ